MRLIRENLFFVVLIGATVVVGGVAVGYYVTSDVGKKLAVRRKASDGLRRLHQRRRKVSDMTVKDLQARIDTLGTTVEKDAEAAVAFNKQNLTMIKLNTGAAVPRDAFPVDEDLYSSLGLHLTFIRQYTRTLNDLFARPDLKRTQLPTRQEIAAEEVLLKEQYKEKAREQALLSMRVKKVKAGMIFIEEDALDRYFVKETKAKAERLWEAQVNLWVTREILQAITSTNQQAFEERTKAGIGPAEGSVLTSAVKRLVKININETFATQTVGAFGRPDKASTGLTGRTSTADYGVIRYRFTVVMPSRHIERLLRNLMMQNYHAVVNLQIGPVVHGKSFYYGTEPVVLAGIDAEMLLLTKWSRPLMPPDVQNKLPR